VQSQLHHLDSFWSQPTRTSRERPRVRWSRVFIVSHRLPSIAIVLVLMGSDELRANASCASVGNISTRRRRSPPGWPSASWR